MLSVDVDDDAAVEARIWNGWNEFRQLVTLLTNKDISSIIRGRLYSCLRSSMLHGSETWPVRQENEMALQWTEMCMVRWMCGIKLKDRGSKWRVERKTRIRWHNLGTTAKQVAMVWACVAKRRQYWVKKCVKWRVPDQEVDQRWLGERLWKKTVRHINWTGSMLWIVVDGGNRQRMIDDHNWCKWVNVSSGANSSG